MFSRILAIVLLAPAVAAAANENDLILRQRITIASSTQPPREQMQYYTASVRITDDDRARTIVDLDRKTFTIIDKKRQTYSVTTFAELEERNRVRDDNVKSLPPNVRQMIHVDDPVLLKPTGATETIAGFKTKEYTIESPSMTGSVWVTQDLHLDARTKEWTKVSTLMGSKNSLGGRLDEALAELKGFPLRQTITMEPLPVSTTEVLEVRHHSPPRQLLQVPHEYKEVPAPKPRLQTKQ